LGIFLYTPSGDSHVGCTICYSVLVFNGGIGPVVCDASNITASVTTPEGTIHPITLSRTYLSSGQFDFYTNAACYTIRTNDILPDGTVRATARDIAVILQNDTPSASTNEQGVNTEVSLPSLKIAAQCVPSVGQNGAITYTGTVTNTGNNTLFNVTVTNSVNGLVANFASIAVSNFASFSGFWIPTNNPCIPSTNIFTAIGNDSFTNCLPPGGISNSVTVFCQNTLTPGIKVTKTCPTQLVPPGQPFTFSGSVSNSGNVTLTNIVVVNNQPASNTTVLIVALLAPNAVTNFTGTYPAPTNCTVTDTLVGTARSVCGVAVTNSTGPVTCTILTIPQLTVTVPCPTPVVPGGSLTYSVTVSNAGSFTVTNIFVLSDQPGPANPVKTVATLASGASTNFSVGPYTVPVNACTVSNTFSATGKDPCTLSTVTNSALPTICPVVTAPAIGVTLACPVVPANAGGPITYTGTVTNSGNVTLINVYVVNNQPSNNTPVIGPLTLAPHASSNFNATFIAPTNACSVSSTVTATGNDNCNPQTVLTSTATAGPCPLNTTTGIIVTKFCPDGQIRPGQPFIFTGSVSNTGNITLTNIVVVNNQPSNNTPVFTQASLAPGEVAYFNNRTNSYLTPTNCSATDTLIATGRSICGVAVSSTNSATCTILTTPLIAVTAACPTNIVPGGSMTYSGTVSNAGDITLTNVVVVSDRPVPNSPVIGPLTLAPHVFANFNAGTYTVPTNACSVTTTFSATGKDCTPTAVTNSFTLTCPITTAPSIGVTLVCPVPSAVPGGLITYTGTVTNSGNVILTNVTVVDNQVSTNPVLVVPSLAPHASSNFTATFTAPIACSVSNTVTATGSDNCTQAMVTNTTSTTCPLVTTPGIKVTKSCPVDQVRPGQQFTFSGSVSNTGNVTLTNIVVVNNQPSNNTPVFTQSSLAPRAVANFRGSYTAPANCTVADTLTATGLSICGDAVTNTVTATCPILTTPRIVVTTSCPTNMAGQGGMLTYSGTVSNAGNITLTNIWVTNNWPYIIPIYVTASLAPGATTNFTGSYVVPQNCCQAWIWVKASGQGCDGVTVTDTDSRTCTVPTSPGIVVTKVCVPTIRHGHPVLLRPGDLLTYSGTVSNAGNITLINVNVVDNQPAPGSPVLTIDFLAPGEVQTYTGSYTVPPDFCGDDTVNAFGFDACSYALVTNSVTATCPMAPYSPRIGVSKQCPPQPTRHGSLLTYSGTVTNMGNVTLVNVSVVDNQPTTNTPVISNITLAPGGFLNFTGSYTAPPVCCESVDTLTARGQDRCSGSNVTATATAICPLLYTPGIALVQDCPPEPLPMGSVYEFSGFVTNTGDAILTNVLVFSSLVCRDDVEKAPIDGQQLPFLPFLGPLDLAPGQAEPYTGCLIVPYNTCEVIVTVTGQETCRGTRITNTVSCPVAVNLGITITEDCQLKGQVTNGSSVNFGGTLCNTGNVTLNIVVFSGQPGDILPSPIGLDPDTCTNFTGSYIALGGFNPTTNSIIVTNFPGDIITNVVSVITTNNTPTVTTNAATPFWFGTINTLNTNVVDRFLIGSNFNGLVYAPEDHGYGATEFYSMHNDISGTYFDTIIASTTAVNNRFGVTNRNFDSLAYASDDVSYGPVIFYYLTHDNAGVSTFGSITPGGVVGVTADHFVVGTNFDALTYTATDVGYGANLFYYVRHDATGLSTFGTINPHLPGTITDRFTVGTNVDALTFTDLIAPGYGPNNFYYLRHDASGASTFGTIFVTTPPTGGPLTGTVTDRFPVGTNAVELTFTATDVAFGPNLFYFLRGSGLTVVTNIVTTYETNLVTTYTTNSEATYTTNIVVSFTPTNTVTAIGTDNCQDSVTAVADCYGPIVPIVLVTGITNSPTSGFSMFSLSFPTQSGRTYTVQYKDALLDPTWTDLPGWSSVPGDGTTWNLTDSMLPVPPGQPTRFYRIMVTTP
jgi:uncharacterized repeat protein (TIGR01451 family)